MDAECMFPSHSPSWGYGQGCRCERCYGWRRAYDLSNRKYANKRRRESRRKAREAKQ